MQPKYSIDAKHAGMNPDFGIDLRSSVSSIDSTLHREALDACDNADFGERMKEIGEYEWKLHIFINQIFGIIKNIQEN